MAYQAGQTSTTGWLTHINLSTENRNKGLFMATAVHDQPGKFYASVKPINTPRQVVNMLVRENKNPTEFLTVDRDFQLGTAHAKLVAGNGEPYYTLQQGQVRQIMTGMTVNMGTTSASNFVDRQYDYVNKSAPQAVGRSRSATRNPPGQQGSRPASASSASPSRQPRSAMRNLVGQPGSRSASASSDCHRRPMTPLQFLE